MHLPPTGSEDAGGGVAAGFALEEAVARAPDAGEGAVYVVEAGGADIPPTGRVQTPYPLRVVRYRERAQRAHRVLTLPFDRVVFGEVFETVLCGCAGSAEEWVRGRGEVVRVGVER